MGLREALALWLLPKQVEEQVALSVLQRVIQQGEAPRRGTAELIAAYRDSPWLRAVVHKIAFKIAAVPWRLLVVRDRPGGRAIRNRTMSGAGYEQRRAMHRQLADRVEVVTDHPLLRMLDIANPLMSGLTARKLTQIYLDLKGEAFWLLNRDNNKIPVEYWPIPPHWVRELPKSDNPFYVLNIKGIQRKIKTEDVVWFKDPDPANPYGRGSGIGESLGDEIDVDEYASLFVKHTFYNRATPELLIGIETSGGKPINEDKLREAETRWEQRHRGFQRANRIAMHSGKMSVERIGATFDELKLNDLRAFERDTFINVYGVPPEILGILQASNRATITESRGIMATEVLIPRLEFLRTEMQQNLVNEFDERYILDYETPSPEDFEFKLDVIKAASWAFAVDEIRALADHHPLDRDAGRIHLVPLNLVPEQLDSPQPRVTPSTEPKGLIAAPRVKLESVELVLEALRPERLAFELEPVWLDQMAEWGTAELVGLEVDLAFNMLNPFVTGHIEKFLGDRLKDINETTRKELRKVLTELVQQGESPRRMVNAIQDVLANRSKAEALRIARSEVTRSATFASLEAYRQSGIVNQKQWITTVDGIQRDAHLALHLVIEDLDQPFETEGDQAMHPGDFSSASLNVNCRCGVVAVVEPLPGEEGQRGLTDEQAKEEWHKFDRRLIPWEDDTVDALGRAFAKQASDAAEVVDRLF